MDKDKILIINKLEKEYISHNNSVYGKEKRVKAVNNISFYVNKGETFSIVGESGCGKSTVGKLIMGLLKPDNGEIIFEDYDITKLGKSDLKKIKSDMQIVFQDPYASLNPRMTILQLITEPLKIQKIGTKDQRESRARSLILDVGLEEEDLDKYPHEFSGGQRQRICIARALALEPKLVICDEPVSALDLLVQAQILNLLKDLQEKFSLTYIFISHNLSVVRYLSNRIAVMYMGKIVEIGEAQQIFSFPNHPYTKNLLSSVLSGNPNIKMDKILLEDSKEKEGVSESGCPFLNRCNYSIDKCRDNNIDFKVVEPGHYVLCHCSEYFTNKGEKNV